MKQFIILTVFSLFFVGTLSAQYEEPEQMIIEGKSSVKITPEQLVFSVRISATDMNYTECTNKVLEKAQKISDEFAKNGIDKNLIKTQNYSIREEREHDYKTNKSVFKGYRAEIPVVIKTLSNNPKNDVIFDIIKNNFSSNFTLNFALTPEQKEEVKDKLIALAIQDAKHKAKVICQNMDISVYRVQKIQYGEPNLVGNHFNMDYGMRKEAIMLRGSSSMGGATSQLSPNEIEMQTSVVIAWKLYKSSVSKKEMK